MATEPRKEQKHATGGQGIAWEDFSAFGDMAELEHVCELLRWQSTLDPLQRHGPEYLTGEKSELINRLNAQARESEKLLEAEKPGLYSRTWMAKLVGGLFLRLDNLTDNPDDLAGAVNQLCEDLHKVLIAAHEIYDPSHRAALVKKKLSKNASVAAKESHAGRAKLREKACAAFMDGGPWDSIAAAVAKIAPTLTACREVSRPLSTNNAARTVREWLSAYIKSTPAARAKLTDAAQKRLKKA